MKRNTLLVIGIGLLVLAGCRSAPVEDYTAVNAQLQGLLPAQLEFRWFYDGFAEYGHKMELKSLISEDSKTVYEITGEVDDVSGGEGDKEYHLNITYIIENGELRQTIDAPMMMDKAYKDLILIKTPIEVGATWEQTVLDDNNNEVKIKALIEQATATDKGKTYKVRYQEQDSDYYEIRVIREGAGIIQFSRLFTSGKENYDIGYALYEEISGVK